MRAPSACRFALTILFVACAAPDPPEAAQADSAAQTPPARPVALPDRDTFRREGLVPLGDSRATLAETLGEPDSVRTAVVPNRHLPEVRDTLFAVHYPGLVVSLHRPGGGGDMLSGVQVRDNRYLRYPVIGATLREVETAFGPANQVEDGRYSYACRVCGPVDEPFEMIVEDGRVQGVRFAYYVD